VLSVEHCQLLLQINCLYMKSLGSIMHKKPTFAAHTIITTALLTCFCGSGAYAAKTKIAASANVTSSGAERIYTHVAVKGDNFSKLAAHFLDKKKAYQILQKYNPSVSPTAIPVGYRVRIPVSAMRAEKATAEVVAVSGNATKNGSALSVGQRVDERDKLATGTDGFVTIKLVDGSTINVQSQSTLEIERARQLANTKVTESVVKLDAGRLETKVAKQHQAGRYEVRTPTSNMGVRGTMFRAGSIAGGKKAMSEVVEGEVGVAGQGQSTAGGLGITAGFGTFVEEGKPPAPPVKLLPAPTLSVLSDSTSPTVAISFPPVAGATGYRVQVALDSTFQQMVAEATSATPDVKLDKLPDGKLNVRVRAIDGAGLEGLNAAQTLNVAARPFAPATVSPAVGQRLNSSAVNFQWRTLSARSDTESAMGYRLQVAGDATFAKPVIDQKVSKESGNATAQSLPAGNYFWRIATLSTNGKQGPFGEAIRFSINPERLVIRPLLSTSATQIVWKKMEGEAYQVQVSRSDKFDEIIKDQIVREGTFILDGLPKNSYYVRVRTVGLDSTIEKPTSAGDWSNEQLIEVFGR
jgi:hypothetical protein